MDKVVPTLIIAAILALIFAMMAIGWRTRGRRQSHVAGLSPVPSEVGAVVLTEYLLYVATTPAEQPLERITVHGLGFRGRAVLTVTESGILLELAGAAADFVPRSALVGVGRATWTIDRALRNDGLVFVRWTQTAASGTVLTLDSNFRSSDPDALVAAVERILPASAPTPEGAAA